MAPWPVEEEKGQGLAPPLLECSHKIVHIIFGHLHLPKLNHMITDGYKEGYKRSRVLIWEMTHPAKSQDSYHYRIRTIRGQLSVSATLIP